MPLLYATTDDLEGWLPTGAPQPANVAQLLRTASQMVRTATRAAIYDTEPSGLPEAGSDAADAMRDAVCAQVEAWAHLGTDPAKGQADAGSVASSKAIGSATINYSVSDVTARARADAATHLCHEATMILTNAGLVTGRIGVTG